MCLFSVYKCLLQKFVFYLAILLLCIVSQSSKWKNNMKGSIRFLVLFREDKLVER
ncbi:hypothetical protein HMPREF9441_03062 [Paraprevotella clara YIT 11840]|uniref:Uncharacterized protein n=1 Tax=Paraprevotella clara YIT 11840 TaxID=762968 RepID=G5SUK2_9BACT|nr:hypothetical protein HMPREF9441_03062 [Paraprevotella clara YIT 11840]